MFYILFWLFRFINMFNPVKFEILFNFDRGTSLVNFCESDMLTNNYSEYFNSWSSLAISLFGFLGIFKILYSDELVDIFKKHQDITIKKQYLLESKSNRYMLNSILVLVGLGSFYFHSELSEFSHWVDISFISLILILSDRYLDNILNYDRKKKYIYYLVGSIHLITSICIPSIHIFIQYATGYYLVKKIDRLINVLEDESKKNYDINLITIRVKKKYQNIKILFLISVILWLIDYFGCIYINPFHVHWIFHIGIGWVSYGIIDLSKYLWLIKFTEISEHRV